MTVAFRAGALSLLACWLAVTSVAARELSIDERVAAQKAIESVYWNHRIWPKENPAPKPPLSTVMADAAIRAKVEDYLKKSNALETWWKRPVTADQLQAELDRMAKHSRDGATLQELYRALGNDPFVIAETLGRQTLVDRLVRSWYASDERFHGDLKAKASAELVTCPSSGCMRSLSGRYRESTVRRDDADWTAHAATVTLPIGVLSSLEETAEAFVVTAVLAKGETGIKTAVVVWPKRSFDAWWSAEQIAISPQLVPPSGRYALPGAAPMACVNDTWSPTRVEVPDAVPWHTAVWTGTELIVWGGTNSGNFNNAGGRYNPATDTWVMTSTSNAPTARARHSAVWTGTQMIIWGGDDGPQKTNSGGRYDPSSDTWAATSTGPNVPEPRNIHSAVWTGTEMVVWGGQGATFLNTGGRYNPSTDTWSTTSTGANVPTARWKHTAVWTGTEMIVWGGHDSSYLGTGGRYQPSTDSWTPTSTAAGVPTPRMLHTAVWTGTEMIIWGGDGGPWLNTGGRYNPSTDSWVATSTGANVPVGRAEHSAIWTESTMIVWGGSNGSPPFLNSGGRYNPSTDSWLPTSAGPNVPAGRLQHTAVWTGSEMVVWGGHMASGEGKLGGRYNPSTDSWATISTGATVPSARFGHAAVWTGTEMIVWGGYSGIEVNTGGRYIPSTDSWTPTSTGANTPLPRLDVPAVWTGTVMIIWGGETAIEPDSGARYNPASNTWAPITSTNAPETRHDATAVWTGTEMIVWGGNSVGYLNTGARYNPSANTWTATSTGANVPAGRWRHSAVWTGTQMIVWGGETSFNVDTNTGGRYNPSTNTWTAMSTGLNTPAARDRHTSVWTGTEMIVWGGATQPGGSVSTGGRYNASSDSWTPTSTSNVPSERSFHRAVWTGLEMIVWGGDVNTGGRYNPLTDGWTATSTGSNAPGSLSYHSAIWAGSQMIVWGGQPDTSTGGLYCACINGRVYYRDADADGYGDAATSVFACEGSVPSGYIADASDCDDVDAHRYAGAPEINDGLDNQCPGDQGYGSRDEISGVTGFLLAGDKTKLSWLSQSGATSYTVARSPYRDHHAGCSLTASSVPTVTDASVPPPGIVFYYLVRATDPIPGSWGRRSPGVERTVCNNCESSADACDDGLTCTVGEVCAGTVCTSGPRSCDDGNPCTTDSCDAVFACAHVNNTLACNDGNACTGGDVCAGGVCAGTIPPGVNHLVLSQVQASGDGSNPLFDEFVEIYNPTNVAISLIGYRLHVVTNTFPSFQTASVSLGSGSIPAHGWLLVASSDYNGSVPRDITLPFGMSSTTESLMLVDSVSSVTSCNPSGLVDKLGYGSSPSCSEGAPAPALTANNSLLRKPAGSCGNGIDTNVNSADFVIQSPSTPRNRTSAPQP